MWDLSNRSLQANLTGDGGSVNAVACTQADGAPIAVTGDDDGSLSIWDLTNLSLQAKLTRDGGSVNAVACTQVASALIAVAAYRDGMVRVWNIGARTVENTLSAHGGSVSAVACTVIDEALVVITGGDDGVIVVWNFATQQVLAYDVPDHVSSIDLSESGDVVVGVGHEVIAFDAVPRSPTFSHLALSMERSPTESRAGTRARRRRWLRWLKG